MSKATKHRMPFGSRLVVPALLLALAGAAMADGPGDSERWVTYNNGALGLFSTLEGPERAMVIDPTDFGLAYPFRVESLLTRFYAGMGGMADPLFWYAIYADDGETELFVSERLTAVSPPAILRYRLPEPVVITSGRFYIAIRPNSLCMYGFPLPYVTTDDRNPAAHSWRGRPGNWVSWTSGEYHMAAFVSTSVGVREIGLPGPVPEFRVGPNPLAGGLATLSYSLPGPGPAVVTVYDVTGRSVFSTRSPGHLATGSLSLDLREVPAGVYLVKLEARGAAATRKLVVR